MPANRGRWRVRQGDFWDGQQIVLEEPVVVDNGLGEVSRFMPPKGGIWVLSIRRSWNGRLRFVINVDLVSITKGSSSGLSVRVNTLFAAGVLSLLLLAVVGASPRWTAAERDLIRSLRAQSVTAAGRDEAEASLGQVLFWDKRLSGTGAVSCASCHNPRFGWSDGRRLPRGGGLRHTPTLWNVATNELFFWDGREDSLEAQALHPIESLLELGGRRDLAARLIARDPELRTLYEQAFGAVPPFAGATQPETSDIDRIFANVGRALAAFERRIVSGDAPFDRFVDALARDEAPPADFPPRAQRGLALFIGRAGCVRCHNGPSFTDGQFHNTGLASREEALILGAPPLPPHAVIAPEMLLPTRHRPADLERVARERRARGEFKTPTLRNVRETAPYMHDGRFANLDDVLAYYSTLENASFHEFGTIPPIRPLRLSQNERDDLIAFLESLTGSLSEPRWAMSPKARWHPANLER